MRANSDDPCVPPASLIRPLIAVLTVVGLSAALRVPPDVRSPTRCSWRPSRILPIGHAFHGEVGAEWGRCEHTRLDRGPGRPGQLGPRACRSASVGVGGPNVRTGGAPRSGSVGRQPRGDQPHSAAGGRCAPHRAEGEAEPRQPATRRAGVPGRDRGSRPRARPSLRVSQAACRERRPPKGAETTGDAWRAGVGDRLDARPGETAGKGRQRATGAKRQEGRAGTSRHTIDHRASTRTTAARPSRTSAVAATRS